MVEKAPRRLPAALFAALGLALCAAAVLAAPAAGQGTEATVAPETQEIGLLFAQTAERGALVHAEGKDSDRFNLVLRRPAGHVVWFQDRPGRASGHIPLAGFVDAWDGFGFAADPPNAALTVLDAPHHRDTAVLTLGTPRHRPQKEKLVYPARLEEEATGNLAHLEPSRDDRVRFRFADASLFIDDADALVIHGCVIAPFTHCPYADLVNAPLLRADLTGADFTGAHLTGANLYEADLVVAHLTGANLSSADLTGANLLAANLTGANLHGAYLSGASLVFANLTGAELVYGELTDADLTGANLTRANLTNARLTRADLTRATYCRTTMPDGSVRNDDC